MVIIIFIVSCQWVARERSCATRLQPTLFSHGRFLSSLLDFDVIAALSDGKLKLSQAVFNETKLFLFITEPSIFKICKFDFLQFLLSCFQCAFFGRGWFDFWLSIYECSPPSIKCFMLQAQFVILAFSHVHGGKFIYQLSQLSRDQLQKSPTVLDINAISCFTERSLDLSPVFKFNLSQKLFREMKKLGKCIFRLSWIHKAAADKEIYSRNVFYQQKCTFEFMNFHNFFLLCWSKKRFFQLECFSASSPIKQLFICCGFSTEFSRHKNFSPELVRTVFSPRYCSASASTQQLNFSPFHESIFDVSHIFSLWPTRTKN